MKFAFYTNSVSPHQLPLAKELVKLMGAKNYKYIYTTKLTNERRNLGWGSEVDAEWCRNGNESDSELHDADVVMSGLRVMSLFESRARDGKKTIYCSERWFKPKMGMLRLLRPSYFRMAYRFVRLLSSKSDFHYFPMGAHAARDMARLCGLMHGDWRCLFSIPELDFERKPGGRVWLKSGKEDRRYCLDKMRMWGYFVERSKCENDGREIVASNKIRVLWVGRLLKWKCVDTIIRAVGECLNVRRSVSLPEITLDVYGIGSEEMRLKKLAARYGDVIKFHPPVPIDQVRKLMRAHDVYVLSSNAYEGWGAVVSEALEEGMKVIGTYEAGASATILPESNLFHAGDWRCLKNILENQILDVSIGDWTADFAAMIVKDKFHKWIVNKQ